MLNENEPAYHLATLLAKIEWNLFNEKQSLILWDFMRFHDEYLVRKMLKTNLLVCVERDNSWGFIAYK